MSEPSSQISAPVFDIVKQEKKALLFGVSGLVGKELMKSICRHQNYGSLLSIGRSPTTANHPKLEHKVIDFNRLQEYKSLIKGDDIYIALGTTIKKAGSRENFEAVDYQMVFDICKIASLNGVSQLMLVTAIGADEDSLFFYNRVKGKLESHTRKLPFWSIHIFRPSLLLGDRDEKRTMERFAIQATRKLSGLAGRWFGGYNPMDPVVLSKSMVAAAQGLRQGTFIYESPHIEELSEKY